jgi:hypothetical protein
MVADWAGVMRRCSQVASRGGISRRGHVTGLAAVSFGNVPVSPDYGLGPRCAPHFSRAPRGLAARPIILHGGAAQQSHLHARGASLHAGRPEARAFYCEKVGRPRY